MDIFKWTTPTINIQIDPIASIENADYIVISFDSKCAHFDIMTDPSSYDESGIVPITLTQEQTGSLRAMQKVDVQANVMSGNTRMASYEGSFTVRRNLYNASLPKGSGASVTFDTNLIRLTLSSEYVVYEGGGSSDYDDLYNKPKYEGITIQGNLTASELGIATSDSVDSLSTTVNTNTSNIAQNTSDITTLVATVSNHNAQIQNNTTAINNLSSTKADKSYVDTQLSTEVTNRENADINLQEQIDALTSKSDVVDIVGTYAQLQAYDTSSLDNNDIVKVLEDSTHDNAMSYYRWNKTTSQWVYVGSEGTYYTKSESDSRFVPQTRTINGLPLSSNVTLAIPSATSELTNDSGYQTATQVSASISTALTGYATETWVENYIASLNATNVRY